MYKVVGHYKSRALRVIWALEELSLEYGLENATPRSDAALALTPSGKIPILVEGDLVHTDSVAIVQYLADKHDGLTHPAGTPERAHQDAMTQWVTCEIDAALWTKTKHRFALPENQRVDAIQATADQEFARAMSLLEKMKGDSPYLAGEFFTIPDLILSHCAGWALSSGLSLPDGAFGAYLKSLRKRPALKAALARGEAA